MQQLMETIRALQQTVAASKADQDKILAERFRPSRQPVRTDSRSIWMSRTSNEELRMTNEELHRELQRMGKLTSKVLSFQLGLVPCLFPRRS